MSRVPPRLHPPGAWSWHPGLPCEQPRSLFSLHGLWFWSIRFHELRIPWCHLFVLFWFASAFEQTSQSVCVQPQALSPLMKMEWVSHTGTLPELHGSHGCRSLPVKRGCEWIESDLSRTETGDLYTESGKLSTLPTPILLIDQLTFGLWFWRLNKVPCI